MTSSHSQTLVNLHGKGIDEPSEWGHREIDGQAREGNGRDEWERTSQILMRYDPTLGQNQTFYYQHDHEGSVTHLTDGNGNLLEQYRYDVFGTPTIYDAANPPHVRTASIVSNRFLFTGREWSAMFGFYEYRARAYHPGLGRFMSEDPKLFDAGDYNLFRYCHNDPIDNTDPMGLYVTLIDPYNKTKEIYNPNSTSKSQFARQYEAGKYQATHNKDGSINQTATKAFSAVEQSSKLNVAITKSKELSYDSHKQLQGDLYIDKKTGQLVSGEIRFPWNPNAARENNNATRNSPGAVLVHEIWHGAGALTNPRAAQGMFYQGTPPGFAPRTGGREEQRVLGLEQRVFPQLNNEGVRTDLGAKSFFYVPDPTIGGRE